MSVQRLKSNNGATMLTQTHDNLQETGLVAQPDASTLLAWQQLQSQILDDESGYAIHSCILHLLHLEKPDC